MLPHEILDLSTRALVREFGERLATEAGAIGVSADSLRESVFSLMRDGLGHDGRAVDWRIRLRLYDYTDLTSPIADTDPDLPVDDPGTELLRGLPAAAKFIIETATAFHNAPCGGLDMVTLRRKIASLRTQMSNGKRAFGWLSADYTVISRKFGVLEETKHLARADVSRTDTVDAPRRIPGAKI